MSKAIAGKTIGRYTIPISDSELDKVLGIIKDAFSSFNIIYEVSVADDDEKKSKDKQTWGYGLFAERKHITFKVSNMEKFSRTPDGTLYSPISEIRFILSKGKGVSTYEKLQKIDFSLQQYPAVVPYCDTAIWQIESFTNGWYRRYWHKIKIPYDGSSIHTSHFIYNTDITNTEFVKELSVLVTSICRVKAGLSA